MYEQGGILAFLTQALGSEYCTGEWTAAGWLVSPRIQLHAFYGCAQCERVGRARALARRELKHLLRGAPCQQTGARGPGVAGKVW